MKKSETKKYTIENGNWEYNGKIFKHNSSYDYIKKNTIKITFNTLFILFFSILLSLQNVQASRVLYISLPIVLKYFPILYLIISIFNIIKYSNNDLTESMYRQSYQRFRKSSNILIILSLVCIIGLIYYSIISNSFLDNIYLIAIEMLILFFSIFNYKLEQK